MNIRICQTIKKSNVVGVGMLHSTPLRLSSNSIFCVKCDPHVVHHFDYFYLGLRRKAVAVEEISPKHLYENMVYCVTPEQSNLKSSEDLLGTGKT